MLLEVFDMIFKQFSVNLLDDLSDKNRQVRSKFNTRYFNSRLFFVFWS